ncbi:hypothetical protein [Caproiciproducens sp. NJN-50]|nr:hypothetical protein [Caproiciproducens sp. NJN-50]
MDIPERRQEIYKAILNLKSKPSLAREERAELAELQAEWNRLIWCGRKA